MAKRVDLLQGNIMTTLVQLALPTSIRICCGANRSEPFAKVAEN